MDIDYQNFFMDNELKLKDSQPDVYEASETLAKLLGIEVGQALAVNSITEISTYCTSIVARSESGEITHVRNLDFQPTDLMAKVIYEQILIKDGKEIGRAPGMAPFYGVFTGRKEGKFSVSYNVRETISPGKTKESLMSNLERNLDPHYKQQSLVMLDLLLSDQIDSFEAAVEMLMFTPMTSPSHFIVGGL